MNDNNNNSNSSASNAKANSGNIPKIILEKLESTPRQNFSTILNSPPEPVIIYITFSHLITKV